MSFFIQNKWNILIALISLGSFISSMIIYLSAKKINDSKEKDNIVNTSGLTSIIAGIFVVIMIGLMVISKKGGSLQYIPPVTPM